MNRTCLVGALVLPALAALAAFARPDREKRYPGALNMHKALTTSRFLTVTGSTNHGQYLYEQNTCTDPIGTSYLLDGKLPGADQTCKGKPHPAPAAAEKAARDLGKDPLLDRPGR